MGKLVMVGLLCFGLSAQAEITEQHLGYLFNVRSTRDQDSDGITDARETWLKISTEYPAWDTMKVCSVYTKNIATANVSLDWAGNEMMYWDLMHRDFDTDSVMGSDSDVDTAGGYRYLLQDMATWLDDNGWWDTITVWIIGPGIALQLTGDGNCGLTNAGQGKVKSVDDAIIVYLEMGVEDDGHILAKGIRRHNTGIWTNPWWNSGISFDPGIKTSYRVYTSGNCGTPSGGTCQPRFITCRLNAPTQGLIDLMIERAASEDTAMTWNGTSWIANGWAVIDGDSASTAPSLIYSRPLYPGGADFRTDSFRTAMVDLFGWSKILRDTITGTVGQNPDAIEQQLGIGAAQTLTTPDSALYYHHLHSYNTPPQTTDVLYHLTFPVKSNAVYIQWASFGCPSLLDTLARGDDQPMIIEAITNGFGAAIGACYESHSSGSPWFWHFPGTMRYADATFAEAALSATVRLGFPLLPWRVTPAPEEPQPPPEPVPLPPGLFATNRSMANAVLSERWGAWRK